MSQLAERFMPTGQPGGAWGVLCRFVAARLQGHGWHEPYESRDSRTDLWGTGGEIPPVYPAHLVVAGVTGHRAGEQRNAPGSKLG